MASCTNCPSILGVNGQITTSPPPNGTYCINQDVTINPSSGDIEFINSKVKIASGVKITIAPNKRLIIDNSHLYGCVDMWKGIVLTQQTIGTVPIGGHLAVRNNSLIEDAEIAIDLSVPTNTATGTSSVELQNSIFNKNNISLKIDNYNYILSPFVNISAQGCVFTSIDIPISTTPSITNLKTSTLTVPPLTTPYLLNGYATNTPNAMLKSPFLGQKPYAGIVVSNVGEEYLNANGYTFSLLSIGGYSQILADIEQKKNIFDNLRYGITGVNTNLVVENCVFQRLIFNPSNGTGADGISLFNTGSKNRIFQATTWASLGSIPSNLFYDCRIAIGIVGYYSVITKKNKIYSTQTINTPNSPNGSYGIYISTPRYANYDISYNQIHNVKNGISFLATTGNINILNNNYTGQYAGMVKINYNDIRPIAGVYPTTTEYVENAISVTNILPVSASPTFATVRGFEIKNNIMYRVRNGIYCYNMGWLPALNAPAYLNIHNNVCDIASKPNATSQDGIANVECKNNFLYNNLVTGPPLNNTDKARGIYTVSNRFQQVKCNYTLHTDIGFLFKGNQSPSIFRQNRMENHLKAYRLESFNSIQGQIGAQGTTVAPSDNEWVGSWTVGTHYMTSTDNSLSNLSPLYVRNSIGFYPTLHDGVFTSNINHPYSSPSGIFIISNAPEIASCPLLPDSICANCPQLLLDETENIESNIEDLFYFDSLGLAEENFIAKDQLFRLLHEHPDLRNNSLFLNSFYTYEQGSTLGKMVDLEQSLAIENWDEAENLLNDFSPYQLVEQNYWNYYNIYVKAHINDMQLEEADSTLLGNLAYSCPQRNGHVVYAARSLYSLLFPFHTAFEDICPTSNIIRLSHRPKVPLLTTPLIYPIVSDGNVYLLVPKVNGNQLLTIIDTDGKEMFHMSCDANDVLVPLMLNLSTGFYFAHFQSLTNNETYTQKIVIH